MGEGVKPIFIDTSYRTTTDYNDNILRFFGHFIHIFVIFTFLQSIKAVEHTCMKKRAEVENLKNLLVAGKTASPPVPLESTPIRHTTSSQLEPPLYTSTPSQSPSQSLLRHSLPTLTPRSQVYYTECDACGKLERKLEKMEDDILRLKKIVQKVTVILF